MTHAQTALIEKLDSVIAAQPEAFVAVAVRDAATGTEINLHADSVFHAASTMKVPVMIEAYRRQEADRLSMDNMLTVKNEFRSIVDGSSYSIEEDSDDVIYERLGEDITFRELIYRMMTVSSNLATNLLIDYLVPDSIQNTVDRLGASGMRVLRGVEDIKAYERGMSNRTTARALANLMQHIMQGTAVSPAADSAMVGIMLHSVSNEMIPSGLPLGTPVANKIGLITRIHHDAAIVYPSEDAPYVLVILIRGIDDATESADLGARLTHIVHNALRPE